MNRTLFKKTMNCNELQSLQSRHEDKKPKDLIFQEVSTSQHLASCFPNVGSTLAIVAEMWHQFWQDAMRHWHLHSPSSLPVQKSTGGTSRNERFHLQTCPQSNMTALQWSPRMTSHISKKEAVVPMEINGAWNSEPFRTSEDMNLGNWRLP